jgi:hypothetical protein
MTPDRKITLDDTEKLKYKIPLDRVAFLFELDKVIEERCDEFDYELEEQGYVIANRDMETAAVSIFNYKVIVFK